jgi:hypothetical protein
MRTLLTFVLEVKCFYFYTSDKGNLILSESKVANAPLFKYYMSKSLIIVFLLLQGTLCNFPQFSSALSE